jgi:hypothetical protein
MLAPKKTMRQGKACRNRDGQSREVSALRRCGRQERDGLESNRVLAAQNSNQRECHDCSRKECQNHPAPQLRVRLRQAQHVYRGIGAVKNHRARRSIRGREYFRRRSRLGGTRPGAFRNFAGHCPDTSTNHRGQKQNFQRINDFAGFKNGVAHQASKEGQPIEPIIAPRIAPSPAPPPPPRR